MEAEAIGDTNAGAYKQQNMINKSILIGERLNIMVIKSTCVLLRYRTNSMVHVFHT